MLKHPARLCYTALQEGEMRGTLKRFFDSPAMWFIGLFFWIWLTARCWDKVVTEGFAGIRIVTAVLATALTGFAILLFFLNRGWRKDNGDS
jgi:hypothetical protein